MAGFDAYGDRPAAPDPRVEPAGNPPGQPRTSPGWSPPQPSRRSTYLIATLLVVAALACAGAAGALLVLVDSDDKAPVTDAGGEPAGDPQPEPEATPADLASSDGRFAAAGQCVRIEEAENGPPELWISTCRDGAYQVLRRFDGATEGEQDAQAKCEQVEGYTNWYFFRSPLTSLDFVLCLKPYRTTN